MKSKSKKYLIGIDEAGRGPLAGPVCVSAFGLEIGKIESFLDQAQRETKISLKDSKKLSKKQRKVWFEYFRKAQKNDLCYFESTCVSNSIIDREGIQKAIQTALNRSLEKLVKKLEKVPKNSKTSPTGVNIEIVLDGGLRASEKFKNQKSFIKGDEKIPIIACASIISKETRDSKMEIYDQQFPDYDFKNNSGYGTKKHFQALKKKGLTRIHRKSFIHNL